MGCFSPDAPAPRDYGAETRDTLQAQVDLAPQLYASEAQYQPQYAQLSLDTLNRILSGGNGTPGLYDLQRTAASQQRAADINDVATLGLQSRNAILAANPDQAALLQRLNQQALAGLDAGTSMTPEEARQVQQASRGALVARGLEDSNAGIADELLKQFNMGQQLQRQRQGFAQSVLGNNQAVVGDIFQQILGRPSGATQQAQSVLAQSGPSLFNPESSYAGNLYNSNQQTQALYDTASNPLASIGGLLGGVGSFAGGLAKL